MTKVVNLRKEPYDVYVGRGSIWGNPYTHLPLKNTKAEFQVSSREEAIEKYEEWIKNKPELLERLEELRGKVLGRYCSPLKCHADVLIKLLDQREAL